MIKTVAELLQKLSEQEAEKLSKSEIKHTVTIGTMYEGLTKSILSQAIPDGFDLKIIDGFVHDGLGGMSGQVDCMLVNGKGKEIPYTGSYMWHVKDVIAVIEVKKSLYTTDLEDAFNHLNLVADNYSRYIQKASGKVSVNLNASLNVYSKITGKIAPPPSEWKSMPTDLHLFLHAIMRDQMAPVRIVFGYGGYKTEASLRKGFIKFIEAKFGQQGYGVPSIPNLIVANGNSLVKLSGHPWATPLHHNGMWSVLGSSSSNTLELMLEVIWTKLSYIRSMPELFGEDLKLEAFSTLVNAKPQRHPTKPDAWGWVYELVEIPQAELSASSKTSDWKPAFLTLSQNDVLIRLCKGEEIRITDNDFIKFIESEGEKVADFVDRLVNTTLVALDGDILKLTTFKCQTMVLPDGRLIGGENNTGRLTRWALKFTEQFKKTNDEDHHDFSSGGDAEVSF